MSNPLSYTLDSLHNRITKVFPAQIRECLAQLDDEQIWWRPNETSNSVGNLVIHLSGSLNHYLNFRIGGIAYDRNREAEFAERRHIPKAELLAVFDDMVSNAEKTFEGITVERLGDPSPEQKMYTLLVEDLISIATHVANHTGQILWVTKMLKDGALHEVWMKAHKHHGGWKPS
ncbi:MAG TPA: DUF1572 family protein [Thermoanaerobaculia bacterium]|nr:DUF1572 family protein [Thermoanaerobaculia bacterium]